MRLHRIVVTVTWDSSKTARMTEIDSRNFSRVFMLKTLLVVSASPFLSIWKEWYAMPDPLASFHHRSLIMNKPTPYSYSVSSVSPRVRPARYNTNPTTRHFMTWDPHSCTGYEVFLVTLVNDLQIFHALANLSLATLNGNVIMGSASWWNVDTTVTNNTQWYYPARKFPNDWTLLTNNLKRDWKKCYGRY